MLASDLRQVQDSGSGHHRADEGSRGKGRVSLPLGYRHRQLRLGALQEPKYMVLGDGFRGVHRVDYASTMNRSSCDT